ncbi:MAG: efflux RND transporter periplasmic adaptor subunit [Bacteroidota bacterium]
MARATLLFLLLVAGCSTPETTAPRVKNLVEAVYASGFVVSDDEHQIFSLADGVVKSIDAPEGSNITADAPILTIESDQQDARRELAWQAVTVARKNAGPQSPVLSELNASLQSILSKHALDSVNFTRFSNLLKQKATTQAEYDRIRLVFENSRNESVAMRSRLERTRNELNLALEQAESQWKITQEDSRNYAVKGSVDGMVFKITKKKGELVRRGELVAVVGKAGKFHLQLSVDELDIQRIREGQVVKVRMDAYAGKIYNGVITRIYPLVDTRQQAVQVDASLTEELPSLFSGLAVEANIIIREKENAIVIPKSLLLPGDSVSVAMESGEQKIKITKGIETLDEVEVLAGLNEQSKLIAPK